MIRWWATRRLNAIDHYFDFSIKYLFRAHWTIGLISTHGLVDWRQPNLWGWAAEVHRLHWLFFSLNLVVQDPSSFQNFPIDRYAQFNSKIWQFRCANWTLLSSLRVNRCSKYFSGIFFSHRFFTHWHLLHCLFSTRFKIEISALSKLKYKSNRYNVILIWRLIVRFFSFNILIN